MSTSVPSATARYVVRVADDAAVDRLDPFAAKARGLLRREVLDEAAVRARHAPPGHVAVALGEQRADGPGPARIAGLGRDPRVGVGVARRQPVQHLEDGV